MLGADVYSDVIACGSCPQPTCERLTIVAGIHDSYTREMYKEYGLFACWLPNTRLALGDVGELRGYRFDRLTSLTDLGVAFTTAEPSSPVDLTYSSAGSVEVSVDGAGGLADRDLVSLSITFSRAGATFFQAGDCVWTAITNTPSVEQRLQALPEWRSRYVVVTKLLRTGPAVVLVSRDKEARVDVRLAPDALAGAAPVARAAGGLSVSRTSSLAVRAELPEGATPLFDAMRLHGRRLRWRGGGTETAESATGFVPVTWDEYAADT